MKRDGECLVIPFWYTRTVEIMQQDRDEGHMTEKEFQEERNLMDQELAEWQHDQEILNAAA